MRRLLRLAGAGATALALGAGLGVAGDAPTVPAGAGPALKKYEAAVAAADADRARQVDKARGQLVTDLRAAQRTALQNNNVDTATAIATLAKQHAAANPGPRPAAAVAVAVAVAVAPPSFVDVAWKAGEARYLLRADGTLLKTSGDGSQTPGRWAIVGDRSVALFINGGWVDVWTFEPGGKAFKAIGYRRDGGYDGKAP